MAATLDPLIAAKLSRLGETGDLAFTLDLKAAANALSQLDATDAIGVLAGLSGKAASLEDPTAWLCEEVQRMVSEQGDGDQDYCDDAEDLPCARSRMEEEAEVNWDVGVDGEASWDAGIDGEVPYDDQEVEVEAEVEGEEEEEDWAADPPPQKQRRVLERAPDTRPVGPAGRPAPPRARQPMVPPTQQQTRPTARPPWQRPQQPGHAPPGHRRPPGPAGLVRAPFKGKGKVKGACGKGVKGSFVGKGMVAPRPALAKGVGKKGKPPPLRLKTELCKMFQAGRCTMGDSCCYSHSEEQREKALNLQLQSLNEQMTRFKTRICFLWREGRCKEGDLCTFAHGWTDMEARPPPGSGYGKKGKGGKGPPAFAMKGGKKSNEAAPPPIPAAPSTPPAGGDEDAEADIHVEGEDVAAPATPPMLGASIEEEEAEAWRGLQEAWPDENIEIPAWQNVEVEGEEPEEEQEAEVEVEEEEDGGEVAAPQTPPGL